MKEETIVSWLLSIPLVLFKKIRAEECLLMPHKVLKLVMVHLKHVNNNVVVAAWSLITKWCPMVAQLVVIAGLHFLSKQLQRGKMRI